MATRLSRMLTVAATAATAALAAAAVPASPAAAVPAGSSLGINWSIPTYPAGYPMQQRNIQVTISGPTGQQNYVFNGPGTSGTVTYPISVAGTYSVTAQCIQGCVLTPPQSQATINDYNGYVQVTPYIPRTSTTSRQCWLASNTPCSLGSY
ncbi:hypothetical protein MRQ36_28740 [Micromonospora sp. R77]|uniref:hypothetical protein n=1 Tax=Micromonospora sp. R77 TaxID=2925836 RepID=UPI001F606329|nr:hypothetical protein [Micromonospora sp. R77]MCI4066325.1 hypothetical protein [Micromonospora sp. R77]